jgi:hypothetical protein
VGGSDAATGVSFTPGVGCGLPRLCLTPECQKESE